MKNKSLPKIKYNVLTNKKISSGSLIDIKTIFDLNLKDKLKLDLSYGLNVTLKENRKQFLNIKRIKKDLFTKKKKKLIINENNKSVIKKIISMDKQKKIKKEKLKNKIIIINNNINRKREYYINIICLKNENNRPDTRIFSNLIAINNKIIMFGGLNNQILNDCWEFDCVLNNWKQIDNSLKYVYKNKLIKFNRKYYWFGGFQSYINTQILTNVFYEIEFKNNKLNFNEISIKNPLLKRKDFGLDSVESYCFIVGGKGENNYIFNDINIVNLKYKKNCNLNIDSLKHGIYGHSISVISNSLTSLKNFKDYFIKVPQSKNKKKYLGIYLFGGKSYYEEYYEDLSIINFQNNKVNIIKPKALGIKPTSRVFHKSHYLEKFNMYLIIGGLNYNKETLNQIYSLNLENFNWVDIKINYDKYLDVNSFSSVYDNNNSIYIFGGYKNNKFVNSYMIKLNIFYKIL